MSDAVGDAVGDAQNEYDKKRPTVGMMSMNTSADQLMWLGAADCARAQGVNLICFAGGLQSKPGTAALPPNVAYDFVNADTVDALIVWGSSGAGLLGSFDQSETLTFLERYRGLPIVNVEKPLEGIPCVYTDTYEGMCRIIDHLIEVHHRQRIALIRGPAGHFENEERARAWADTLQAHGLVVDDRLASPPAGWNEEDGAAAMRLLLDERHLRPGIDFDAVVTTEAQYAVGALAVLQAQGVSVPDDVSLAAFNDVASAETVVPAVTVMRKPFYESGRRTLQVVLGSLRKEPVPDLQDVPAEMVIRRSCGCWPDEISAAGSLSSLPADQDIDAARDRVVHTLGHILESMVPPSVPSDALVQSAERLVSTFLSALAPANEAHTSDNVFLSVFESMMRQVKLDRTQAGRWHSVLSTLREHLGPMLNGDQLVLAEAMWQQARVLVGHQVQRSEIEFRLEQARQIGSVRAFETQMTLAESVEVLAQVIARELPELGIRSGYLALYDDPEHPLDEVELVLAYRDSERLTIPVRERHYPSWQLLPLDLLSTDRSYQLVVLPLYVQEQQLGFAVLEIGPADGSLYTLIQQEISNALQSVLAAERRRQIEIELAQERALLRTLIDNLPDYVYIKDRQSRFVLNNAAHIRVLGARTQEDVVGKNDHDIFPEELAAQYYAYEQKLMEADEALIDLEELVIDQQTGQEQRVLSTKVPLHDEQGNVTGFVGLTRDITLLKQAEENLERYAATMERRAAQFRAASEVARDAATIRELDELLDRTANLVRDRFQYDYAGVFLVD
ncbi:MAG: substrate-binding domain-containing protein, partial [Anaerolineae bacterium]|nr:substrate-binding domain-containing protein [Anaerolineae bacterium]